MKGSEVSMKAKETENTAPNRKAPTISLQEITDKLEQGIQDLFNSDRYKAYLSVMAKFYNYSINNTILIAMQKPDATLVAGFSAWQKNFERTVKKGEKGIKIIAPCPRIIRKDVPQIDHTTQKPLYDENGIVVSVQKEITVPSYKVVTVFDVSQTEGKELPNIAVDVINGQVKQYDDFMKALSESVSVPITFEKLQPKLHGYYNSMTQNIVIAEGMSELQTIKTLIHEIAHSILHGEEGEQHLADRNTKEVQAESIAYTVCQHYGLDTSDYSFGYVAGWSQNKGVDELKNSLSVIQATAQEMIEKVDTYMLEIQKEREKQIGVTTDKPSIRNQLKHEIKTEVLTKEYKTKTAELEV